MIDKVLRFLRGSGFRWIGVGVGFLALGLTISFVLIDFCGLPVTVGTLVSLLLGALARFFVIDAWVFRPMPGHPTVWKRFWRYQAAHAAAYAGGWAIINGVVWLGINYLIATLIATAITTSLSMLSHFQWVWKPALPPAAPVSVPADPAA